MSLRRSRLSPLVSVFLLAAVAAVISAQTVEYGERQTNERQPPDKIMDAIGVKAGMVIGEIGAGRGRYTVHLAARVGPSGTVYANDINADGLAHIRERCSKDGLANVETILGRSDDPLFPAGKLDMIFMVLTYHHLSQPVEMLKAMVPSLKPGATVVVIDPDPVKDHDPGPESTSKEEIERDAAAAGYELVRVETFLARDNIFVLRVKPPRLPTSGPS
jgi:ubiquinone/menaquinone biosynthesis C-methylase UbiE